MNQTTVKTTRVRTNLFGRLWSCKRGEVMEKIAVVGAGVVMAIAASRVLDAGAQGAAASINQNVGGAVGGK